MPPRSLSDSFLDSFASYIDFNDRYNNFNDHYYSTEQINSAINSFISQEPTIDFSFGNRTDDKIKVLEERIEKLEEMIGILLDKRG
jgi:hypothetical protein